ncbi:hypothetical protein [Hyphomicrobium sp.]|uniref:hypothetical protein n=1 Tax=Hyphomicrobium sp. TaxID=82 RepID=UPI002FDCF5F8
MISQMMVRAMGRTALALLAAVSLSTLGQARECRTEPIVAEGQPAMSRDLGAYQSSLFAWRRVVAEKLGPEFNSWRYADARSVDCKQIGTEKGTRWVCKRSALPCKDTLSTVLKGEKLEKFACQSEPVSAYGRREKTEAEALEQAKWAWRIDVRKKFDASWAMWDNATGADSDCRKISGKFQCVGVATPCKEK